MAIVFTVPGGVSNPARNVHVNDSIKLTGYEWCGRGWETPSSY